MIQPCRGPCIFQQGLKMLKECRGGWNSMVDGTALPRASHERWLLTAPSTCFLLWDPSEADDSLKRDGQRTLHLGAWPAYGVAALPACQTSFKRGLHGQPAPLAASTIWARRKQLRSLRESTRGVPQAHACSVKKSISSCNCGGGTPKAFLAVMAAGTAAAGTCGDVQHAPPARMTVRQRQSDL